MNINIKRWLGTLGLLFIVAAVVKNGIGDSLGVSQLMAQEPNIMTPVYSTVHLILSLFVHVTQFIFHIVNAMIPIVWDQRLLFAINQNNTLLDLWRFSRDITNIVLAVMLAAGAVMTVVKADSSIVQQYYKQFILAIILVNFSWFFPRVVLDVAHVLTASVYQVPDIVLDKGEDCTVARYTHLGDGVLGPGTASPEWNVSKTPCTVIVRYLFSTTHPVDTGSLIVGGGAGWHNPVPMIYYCDAVYTGRGPIDATSCEEPKTSAGFSLAGRSNNVGYTLMNSMVMNYARLADLTVIADFAKDNGDLSTPTTAIKTAILFIIQMFFILFLLIILTMATLAILVAFAIRMVIIWLCVSFMPFYFLGFVFPHWGLQHAKEILEKYFLPAAFLPLLIAAPISLGFVMLGLGRSIFDCSKPLEGGLTDFQFACDEHLPLLFGNPALIEMLWMFISIAVIWKGVFMAMKTVDVINDATANIKKWGEGAMTTSVKRLVDIPLPTAGFNINKDERGEGGGVTSPRDMMDKAKQKIRGLRGSSPAPSDADRKQRIESASQKFKNEGGKTHVEIKNFMKDTNRSHENKDALQKILRESGLKDKQEILDAIQQLPQSMQDRLKPFKSKLKDT